MIYFWLWLIVTLAVMGFCATKVEYGVPRDGWHLDITDIIVCGLVWPVWAIGWAVVIIFLVLYAVACVAASLCKPHRRRSKNR